MEHKKKFGKLLMLILVLVAASAAAGAAGIVPWSGLSQTLRLSLTALVQVALLVLAAVTLTQVVVFLMTLYQPKSHRGRTLLTLANSLIHYAAALVTLYLALTILGVDVATIVASVSVLALIIGFGAERLISDMVTGMFMLFENQCNVGDIVEVGGFRGTIQEIGLRTTSLVDGGGNIKIINNGDVHRHVDTISGAHTHVHADERCSEYLLSRSLHSAHPCGQQRHRFSFLAATLTIRHRCHLSASSTGDSVLLSRLCGRIAGWKL